MINLSLTEEQARLVLYNMKKSNSSIKFVCENKPIDASKKDYLMQKVEKQQVIIDMLGQAMDGDLSGNYNNGNYR